MQTKAVVWFILLPLVASYPPHKAEADHLHYDHGKQPDVIVVVKERPEDIHDKHYFDGKVKVTQGYVLPAEHRSHGDEHEDHHVYVGTGEVTVGHREYGHHDDFTKGHHIEDKREPSVGHGLQNTPVVYDGSKVKVTQGYILPGEHHSYGDEHKDHHAYDDVDHRVYEHHEDFTKGHYIGKEKLAPSVEYSFHSTPIGFDGSHFVKSDEFSPFDFSDDDDDEDDSYDGFPFSLDDYRR